MLPINKKTTIKTTASFLRLDRIFCSSIKIPSPRDRSPGLYWKAPSLPANIVKINILEKINSYFIIFLRSVKAICSFFPFFLKNIHIRVPRPLAGALFSHKYSLKLENLFPVYFCSFLISFKQRCIAVSPDSISISGWVPSRSLQVPSSLRK